MCDAYAAVAAVLAIGQTYVQGEQQSRSTEAARRQAYDELQQRRDDTRQAQQQVQEIETSQLSERALEAQRELAFLQTAAGEYGGGLTSERLVSLADSDANRDYATIRNNAGRELTQLSRASAADLATYRSRLDILRSNAPSRTGQLLKIGGAAYNIAADYQRRQPSRSGQRFSYQDDGF